jgi:predicted Rossmann-fold nucleotide-binding protein
MADRKEKMREGTCAAIALPGGPGTLDELFETWTLSKLGRYPGKVIAYDAGGFYAPLRALVAALFDEKMLYDHARNLLRFATGAEEILSMIESE